MATTSSDFTTSKRSSTVARASSSKHSHLSSPPAALTMSIATIQVILRGIGFESLPPLPIISNIFGFLKCVNLSLVVLGLNVIPFEVGWDLFVWKPISEQSEPKSALGPSEVQTEVFVADDSSLPEGDSDSVMVETRFEPVSDKSTFGTRSEPILEIGEAGIEPPLVFEEDVDYSFNRVVDFEKDEEVEISILVVQPKTIQVQTSGEGQKRKRIKMSAGRTDLPLVHKFRAMQAKASSSPSQSKSASPKTTPKPIRKSHRLASQGTLRAVKSAGPFEQEPMLVEESVSSLESSPVRDTGNTPAAQSPTQVSPAQPSTNGISAIPVEPSSKQTPPIQKTPSKKTVSKRRLLPNRFPNMALLRVNMSSQAPRKLKRPHFFKIGSTSSMEGGEG